MAGAQSRALHPSTPKRRALPYAMSDCKITLLPTISCAHCTETVLDIVEPRYERKDYAQEEFTRLQGGVERQTVPNGEQFTTQVDVKDIYPEQKALRISSRKDS